MAAELRWVLALGLLALAWPGSVPKVLAQEVVSPLHWDTERYSGEQLPRPLGALMAVDTLTLPFLDDFSGRSVLPSAGRWQVASGTYRNDRFAVSPPSQGVVTFDGLNSQGAPYDISAPDTYGFADLLQSAPLDLSMYLAGDSVYLSFYYQSQGLGEAPETQDSLILDFWNKGSGKWDRVWAVPGGGYRPFKEVLLPVADAAYLVRGFAFRFRNKATLSGNLDHWNLDYVYLQAQRSRMDTFYNDRAFLGGTQAAIEGYTAVPFRHFAQYKPITTRQTIYNLGASQANLQARLKVNLDQFTVYDPAPVALNPAARSFALATFPGWTPPGGLSAPALLEYLYTLNTTGELITQNDTLRDVYPLQYTLARDDGSAEFGYGLNTEGGRLAMRFNARVPDTLVAVDMHFTRILQDQGNRLFALAVWTDLNADPVYFLGSQKPAYSAQHNGFSRYTVDPPLPVSGEFWVGWIQKDAVSLNLGLDRNITSNEHMMFNVSGSWQQSAVPGTWMIRSVLGKGGLASAPGRAGSGTQARIWPQPLGEAQQWELELNTWLNGPARISYFDLSGRMVHRETADLQHGHAWLQRPPLSLPCIMELHGPEGIIVRDLVF